MITPKSVAQHLLAVAVEANGRKRREEMAKVVMTRYETVENRLVYPECPLSGEDPEYPSKEVICSKPTVEEHYCSSMNEKGVCPFDAMKRQTTPSDAGGGK